MSTLGGTFPGASRGYFNFLREHKWRVVSSLSQRKLISPKRIEPQFSAEMISAKDKA
jgi:hypothetical protein